MLVFGQKLTKKITRRGRDFLPGIIIIALVMLARYTGGLQILELIIFDSFLHVRPLEPRDERIVIVGINERDIKTIGIWPIPDGDLAKLLRTLAELNPRVMGLDLVRNLPVEPGNEELMATLKENENLIVVEKAFPPQTIAPPPGLPPERVGFADVPPDEDHRDRRILLGGPTPKGYRFSFPLRLAQTYLSREGISLDNGKRDPEAMRFGSRELPRFRPNSGGYVRTDAGGVQMLLNFRNNPAAFRVLSFEDIMLGGLDSRSLKAALRDRIVIVGAMAPSLKDTNQTRAIAGLKPSNQLYGVEFHGHGVSQILSAVLDGRPLIKTLPDLWEYVSIFVAGGLLIFLAQIAPSPWKSFSYTGSVSLVWVVGAYLLLAVGGWWIPVAPVLVILALTTVARAIQEYNLRLRAENLRLQVEIDAANQIINVANQTIEKAFRLIHNGPLQTLAYILRVARDQKSSGDSQTESLILSLEKLDRDIRSVENNLKEHLDVFQPEDNGKQKIYLGNNEKVDLTLPTEELFYKVLEITMKRIIFEESNLNFLVKHFDPINPQQVTGEQKKQLCLFLEEALCNVAKHARSTTMLTVTGKKTENRYTLTIQDNGQGISSSCHEGKGTKECRNIAKKLGGEFKRFRSAESAGTICELSWPLKAQTEGV